jgi:hypothetical protein
MTIPIGRVALRQLAPAEARLAGPAPAVPAPVAEVDPVEALRQRLSGRSAREHVVLDFLADDLREVREALGNIQRYVQGIERAVADPRLTPQQLVTLSQGGGPAEQLDYLGEMLTNTRRRLGQVAARM